MINITGQIHTATHLIASTLIKTCISIRACIVIYYYIMYRKKQFLRVKSTEMRELDFNFETFVGYTHYCYLNIPIFFY